MKMYFLLKDVNFPASRSLVFRGCNPKEGTGNFQRGLAFFFYFFFEFFLVESDSLKGGYCVSRYLGY